MSGVVRCSKFVRPPAGQCLALVAAGKKCKLTGIGLTDGRQPVSGNLHRLFPLNLAKFALAALTNP